MEETFDEDDPLTLLSQFEEAPLHIEETFDLVLPPEPGNQQSAKLSQLSYKLPPEPDDQLKAKKPRQSTDVRNIIEEVLIDSEDDDDDERKKKTGNQSLLAQMLQSSSTPSPGPSGLSSLAQKVPNVTIFKNSKPSSPVRSRGNVWPKLLEYKISKEMRNFAISVGT